jgi:outer membrane protein assembly factor BamB
VPKTGMLLWRVSARDPDGQPATFTSGPLLAGNRLFAVLSTTAGVRAEHYLASYTTRRGVRLWCTPLYEGPADAAPARLLTWAGDRVIYATHQGQIIAADPATGQPLWSVRYPSRTLRASPLGPLPAIYDAGHVVVAPRDAPLLLCIDSATGRVMWELPVDNITSLAGVSDGMVVFTTRHGIEAVDLVSGGGARSWRQPSGGRLPTAGRGLLAGPLLYWPTHDERLPLRTLEIATGSSFPSNFSLRLDPSRFHPLPPGNFAFGERSLAIGTRDELVVFTPRQAKPPAAE